MLQRNASDWTLDSATQFNPSYILKPTVTALARMSLSIAVNDYINKEKPIPQKLRNCALEEL
jgi:hypothetical protein